MININIYTPDNKPSNETKEQIAAFLHRHLGKYGDPQPDIEKAIRYALKETESCGGFVFTLYLDDEPTGAAVVNKTGMTGYIPENILVYIAVDSSVRGKGIGTKLLQKVINTVEGSIALHLDPDNPARSLYERMGFEVKYLEMRLERSNQV